MRGSIYLSRMVATFTDGGDGADIDPLRAQFKTLLQDLTPTTSVI